ncbi:MULTISPECIES: hypothetical protein [Pseudomonas]|uniref:hypothetical protein n=1 Tax=Pseudomonas TaxID=286 RepID=UPI0011AFB88D|nr:MULTISPECIES: hypothetical protein [Pseudomonas]MCE0944067.1 hypothetical protein [Pseudomonas asiatica]MCE1064976.1 hypothetical protein [Pseudomonas asiatica]WJR24490.1 hypothetical protein LU687_008925 [Pseudomonas asiatica]
MFIRLNPLGLGEAELRKDSTGFEDPRTHSDYLLFLAGYRETHPEPLQHTEQHQGEPVAWQVRSKTNRPESQWTPWKECCEMTRAMHSHEVGRFNQFGIMREMRPLYSHADPGEVERLTEQLEVANQTIAYAARQAEEKQKVTDALMADAKQFRGERDTLRAQLAERDALLVDIRLSGMDDERCARVDLLLSSGAYANAINKHPLLRTSSDNAAIEVFLSASAEPSVPLAWHVGGNGYDRICFEKPADLPGSPCTQAIHDQRQLIDLLKRYDLRNEEAGAPVELDQLTDLATWKRRAIEAESKLRTYDPQVVELGERAMQALLADPKPSELVLTKCRLCDQLQADLTARDQRIDQFEQVMQKVATLRGTLEQHGLLEEVEALLWPDLHSRPEERGTPETEPCSGCGAPGWTGACNKCVPY